MKSKFVCRPSVASIISPGPYAQTFFFIFEKKKNFRIFFRQNSLKSLLNLFKLFLKFILSGPHKNTVLDFSNFEFFDFSGFFFSFSLTWDPTYGSQNFKTLLLPHITFESLEPFPGYSSMWS